MIKAENSGITPHKGVKYYTVREGDTLADILRISGASIRELKARNSRCNLLNLQPGERLRAPRVCPAKHAYRVRRGEDVYTLARKFGSSVVALLKINPDLRPAEIKHGMCIALPEDS